MRNFCHKLPMITQEEIDNLNSPVSITQIEIVFKNIFMNKLQIHMALLVNCIEYLRKK